MAEVRLDRNDASPTAVEILQEAADHGHVLALRYLTIGAAKYSEKVNMSELESLVRSLGKAQAAVTIEGTSPTAWRGQRFPVLTL